MLLNYFESRKLYTIAYNSLHLNNFIRIQATYNTTFKSYDSLKSISKNKTLIRSFCQSSLYDESVQFALEPSSRQERKHRSSTLCTEELRLPRERPSIQLLFLLLATILGSLQGGFVGGGEQDGQNLQRLLRSRRVGMRRPPLRLNVFCRESRKSSRTLARTSRIPYVLLTDRIGFVSFHLSRKNFLKLLNEPIELFSTSLYQLHFDEFFRLVSFLNSCP